MNKIQELFEEFKAVFAGRGARLLESLLPLLIFLIANPLIGQDIALVSALIVASGFFIRKLFLRESLVYSLGGLSGIFLAALFAKLSNSETGFFLPGLISGAITITICVVSVVVNRPVAAWSSFVSRWWPLEWYWHPGVLPAYNEVTIIWAVAFAGRFGLEFWFYQQKAIVLLSTIRLILSWPFIGMLLVTSYLYGMWRLGQLQGPSIEEYRIGKQPPWEGQRRGF
jgi:hypothetical protein